MQLIATDNSSAIVGLGMTGLSCARHLARKQRPFSVVDSRQQPPLLEEFQQEFPDTLISLGEISDQALAGAKQLIVSPGISLEEPAISRAIAEGASVCGDIDLFREEARAPIVAITGSNGKTTVTTLLGELANYCGVNVAVGGNIGIPALDLLEKENTELYVLELSSFQLERSQQLAVEVATVLNLSADHMDRYSGMPAYHQAKHRIFRGCKKAVINRGDALTKPLVPDSVELWSFGLNAPDKRGFGLREEQGQEYLAFEFKTLMPVSELKLAGRHNIENALAALALGAAAGLPIDGMLAALREFKGLPHRCEYLRTLNGAHYYNDSKGTNVGATLAAIEGLASAEGKIILIAGGVAKGADFKPLLPAIQRYCKRVITIGESAATLTGLVGDELSLAAGSLEQAVNLAAGETQAGDLVLLSPACASFDMFSSYEHRGQVFVDAVERLAQEAEQ